MPVAAQQDAGDPPGPSLDLDLTTGVLVSDNIDRERDPAGTSSISTTSLGLTYDTRTKRERFTLQTGARLEFGSYANDEEQEDGGGIESPFVSLSYGREARRASFALDARYSEVDVGFGTVTDADGQDLIVDQGTRVDTLLGTELTLGTDTPLSYSLGVSYRERRFVDTTDPDLDDQTTATIGQTLSFALNQTTRLVFSLDYRERDAEDEEETFETNTTAAIGLTTETRGGVTASGRLGYSVEEITRTIDGDRETDTEEAPVLSFSLSRALPDGSISGTLSRTLDEQGSRTSLLFGRAVDLRRGGFDASVGVSAGDDDDELRLIGSLALERPTPRGGLTLSLSQEVTSDADGDYLRTDAGLGYRHELTRLSQLTLTMEVTAVDAVDPDEADRQRAQVEIAFSRQLTEDWSFNAGFRHFTAEETDLDPVVENAVFANLSRRFDLIP
jgi:hypothetical protein